MRTPCEHCPWRVRNHGRRTPWGFYTRTNLRRLWAAIRRGGGKQSCHPTDPSHPDHIAAGAREGATAQECPGSVILVLREFEILAGARRVIDGAAISRYLATRRDGLTKAGIRYWLIERHQFGGVPFIGGPPLPEVDTACPGIARPWHCVAGDDLKHDR